MVRERAARFRGIGDVFLGGRAEAGSGSRSLPRHSPCSTRHRRRPNTPRRCAPAGGAGRTNAQIGTELFISPKTASVHVSNILRKLGASGRAQAAATAERAGLFDAPRDEQGLE